MFSIDEKQKKRSKKTHESKTSTYNSSRITYGRCLRVNDTYERLNRIGRGTYGTVYRAKDKQNGSIVALKRIMLHHESSDGFPLTSIREISVLRLLNGGPGIVKLLDVAVSSSRDGVFLVLEYCEHDLGELIHDYYIEKKMSPFSESAVKQLSLQLLTALDFLHSRHIIHRDIKLSNLLYNHRGQLKLADFGLARRISISNTKDTGRPLTPKVASLWYRAPELLLGCSIYDNAIDNWAAGLIVAELLTGEPIIKGHHEIDQIQRMFILLGEPNLTIWPGLKDMPMFQDNAVKFSMKCEVPLQEPTARFFDLLKPFVTSASGVLFLQSLLMYDPFQRVTAKEALKSSYFVDHPIPTSPRLMPTFRSKHH